MDTATSRIPTIHDSRIMTDMMIINKSIKALVCVQKGETFKSRVLFVKRNGRWV